MPGKAVDACPSDSDLSSELIVIPSPASLFFALLELDVLLFVFQLVKIFAPAATAVEAEAEDPAREPAAVLTPVRFVIRAVVSLASTIYLRCGNGLHFT